VSEFVRALPGALLVVLAAFAATAGLVGLIYWIEGWSLLVIGILMTLCVAWFVSLQ